MSGGKKFKMSCTGHNEYRELLYIFAPSVFKVNDKIFKDDGFF